MGSELKACKFSDQVLVLSSGLVPGLVPRRDSTLCLCEFVKVPAQRVIKETLPGLRQSFA